MLAELNITAIAVYIARSGATRKKDLRQTDNEDGIALATILRETEFSGSIGQVYELT
jgi:hypothetical protein